MPLTHILESCLYADDLERAATFYQEVLGLTVESRQDGRHVFIHCGQRMLLLFNPLASREATDQFPGHGSFGPGHLAFGMRENEIDGWIERLQSHQVAIEKILHWPGGQRSVYFRDPSGNLLEFVSPQIWGISEETL